MAEAINLQSAAEYLGMTPDSLHAMAWAKIGPPSNGSYWFPTFERSELERWKKQHATGRDILPGRSIGTKAIYRARQTLNQKLK